MNGGGVIQSIQYICVYTFVQKKRENERRQQRERRRGEKNMNVNKRSLRGLAGKLSHLGKSKES